MFRIETSNRQSDIALDIAAIEGAVRAALKCESIAEAEISVAVVDSDEMQRLNNQFLSHDYDTDVLSFLLDESENERGRVIEGEVIVSAGMAAQQASKFEWSVQNELALYLVHGTLHLCGYDDLTPELREEMRQREIAVLKTLGLEPRYEDSE